MRLPLQIAIVIIVQGVILAPFRSADACIVPVKLNFEDYRQAEVIFKGTLLHYRPGASGQGWRPAILVFDVDQTYKGQDRSRWVLEWENSTFGWPETWRRSKILIVGAVRNNIRAFHPTLADLVPIGDSETDVFHVAQVLCAPPLVYDFTPEIERRLLNILAESPAD